MLELQPYSVEQSLRSHRAITLLTQGFSNLFVAKTAISMLRYRGADIVAILDDQVDETNAAELFQVSGEFGQIPVAKEIPKDSDALYIGIAPPGGKLPSEWRPVVLNAIRMKMDIVSGLHDFLSADPEFVALAEANDVQLIDVRQNQITEIATGQPFRPDCLRILSVGQDCSVGKMVATLEVNRGLVERGFDSQFLASGQTGIMITGTGVPVDCVAADFANGAVEDLVRRNDQHDFVLVEGQGSISHPAFSAVTLGLLHGCRPDGMIFCYEAGRQQIKGLNDLDLPSIASQMNALETMANLLNESRFIGVAVNTRMLTPDDAKAEVARIEQEFGLPACDVYRDGADKLVDACIALKQDKGIAQ
ncbi:DUF1611 domain-containing protein [Mariniblastus fucicola]|uniref:DUF1611 domain-containing protein n=1 Tax=Mariniblastus fucicola TaxID=980251 RepID=A0A5B9P8W5_9BACT|nr:DUF1611 domain-containing protein [Mariniblastus fucicola]QEG21889.1 hypothetical protein MFFC18_17500 [Mariniblastus fucicola]